MKERHWISLVTSVRHGQSILVLGPEIPAGIAGGAPSGPPAGSFAEALTAALAAEPAGQRRYPGRGRTAV